MALEEPKISKNLSGNQQKSNKSKNGKPTQRLVKSKVTARNEKIQGTNDSSIVSKRSVERLYWSKRTPGINGKLIKDQKTIVEFFRPFVSKPQRRSPTINRGYWTRMEAIMNHIEFTINSSPYPRNVVVGLGAGFDPYPFQYLYNHAEEKSSEIVFLDVDFPDLIKRKVSMIQQAPEVLNVIGEQLPIPENLKDMVQLRTSSYIALGCDLTKLNDFTKALETLFDPEKTVFTFTAEVSITYMPQKDADSVIEWASKFKHSRFVLLEQILPSGPTHPFAKTMLKHFNQLNTPLNSVLKYQKVSDQKNRFKSLSWATVQASDLATFYDTAITDEQKEFLDSIEAFDEWEEFILFCQHYVILFASTNTLDQSPFIKEFSPVNTTITKSFQNIITNAAPSSFHKKFAGGSNFSSNSLIVNGGLSISRTNDSVLISTESSTPFVMEQETFQERMCHTLTYLEKSNQIMLVGGRLAPNKPLSDCWLLSGSKWEKVQDLTSPRYRHHSIATKDDDVIVFGGRGLKTDTMDWVIFSSGVWKSLNSIGDELPNLYSSATAWDKASSRGYIFGGHLNDNTLNTRIYYFEVSSNVKIVDISSQFDTESRLLLSRVGAKACYLNGLVYVVGGVNNSQVKDMNYTAVEFDPENGNVSPLRFTENLLDSSSLETSPILVGFNMDVINESLVTYGGGAVCFSFGSFWDNVTIFQPHESNLKNLHIIHKSAKLVTAIPEKKEHRLISTIPSPVTEVNLDSIGSTFQDFLEKVYVKQVPQVFRGLNLGPCLKNWKDPDYLIKTVGEDYKIIAHISEASNMNFAAKNFEYKTMPFGDFISNVFTQDNSKKYYLRSLSVDNPKTHPAIFRQDFPQLEQDFILPPSLENLNQVQFSSPLRIATPHTAIWLHYDVTANVLFQIVGRKTVRLYAPSEVSHLHISPGASTSVIEDIFACNSNDLSLNSQPFEVELHPGDAIFIPACWLHAIRSEESSISLNYFWRDLDTRHYAAGKDVYGNRDLAGYEQGRTMINKLISSFDGTPLEVKKFYLQRLADELNNCIHNL